MLDEVVVLGGCQVHELVHVVHGVVAGVGWVGGGALLGAVQESAKILVEVGKKDAGGG